MATAGGGKAIDAVGNGIALEDVRDASESRQRIAADTLGVGVWDYSPRSGALVCDARCRELFGMPAGVKVSYETFLAGVHADDRARARACIEGALRSGAGDSYVECRTARAGEGVERWIACRGRAFFEDGAAVRFVGTVLDITEQRRDKCAIELLAAAGAVLAEPIEYDKRVRETARMAVEHLADFCMVEILDGNDRLRLAAVAHIDATKEETIRQILKRYSLDADHHPVLVVIRSGRPELARVSAASVAAVATEPMHLRMALSVFVGSRIIVPLTARGRTFGALKLGRGPAREPFDEADLQIAVELARRAAVAMDNALLLQQADDARAWMTRLQAVTAGLSEARTSEQVVDVAFSHACDAFDARLGSIYYVCEESRELVLTRSLGFSANLAAAWQRIPLDLELPVTEAANTRTPVFCETHEEFAARFPLGAGSVLAEVAARVAVPILACGRARVVFALAFTPQRSFSADDRALLTAISRQAGTALERARLYEAEAKAREAAEAASRVKDDFLATVSHELRTPLTAILGWSRMLAAGSVPASRRRHALQVIERNARAQASLIEDLLDLSRIVAGRLRLDVGPVELADVIDMAVETARPAAYAKRVELRADMDRGAGLVVGDASRLQQVALNLLGNAIKFTPPKGVVSIALRREADDVVLSVSDTGDGIDPEFLPFIFERFRQAEVGANRAHGGLGLGLAIARHLVEQHGGRIEAHSEGRGRGSTFVVRFPVGAEPPSACPPIGAPVWDSAPSLEGIRILVVDDDDDTRELLFGILEPYKAAVSVAATVAEALEVFEQTRPDIVLSDIGMPGESGYELLERIHAKPASEGGHTPVVALTAYARNEDRARSLRAGFTAHVAKPIDPITLVVLLGSLVRARSGDVAGARAG